MSAFEDMECQNHANCGDYCETEREREMVLCEDCLDSFDQRQADLAELTRLREQLERWHALDLKRDAEVVKLKAAAEKAGHLIEQMAQAIGANDEYGDFAAEIEAAEKFAGELINLAGGDL
jgi:reverse gyrase